MPTPFVLLNVSTSELLGGVEVTMYSSARSGGADGLVAVYPVVGGVVNVTTVLQGPITLRAVGVDLAGNRALQPSVITLVSVSVVPLVTLTQPPTPLSNHGSLSLSVVSPNSIPSLLAGFAFSATPAVPSLDGTLAAVVSGTPVTSLTVPFTVSTSAAYSLHVAAYDVLGRYGPNVTVAFVVDMDPPTSRFTSPLPPYVNASSVTVSPSGSDALSSVTTLVRVDGGPWLATSTFAGLPEGRHVFDVQAIDAAGNVQPPPYASTTSVVDTVPPTLVVLTATGAPVPLYTNAAAPRVCVHVTDASPTTVSVVVDGGATAVSSDGCASLPLGMAGNHTVAVSAIDVAGNPSAVTAFWIVSDFSSPDHVFTRDRPSGCTTDSGVTACPTAASAVFSVLCSEGVSLTATAPCAVQWVLQQFTSAASCAQAAQVPDGSLWQSNGAAAASVDVSDRVQAFVATTGVARFVEFSRAVDGAGNVGPSSSFEWWVDTVPPLPAVVTSAPAPVVLTNLAHFVFRLVGDTSPGRVSFEYNLTQDGVPFEQASGNPVIAAPAPSNNDPVELALAGLAADSVYEVAVWTRSQAGVLSRRPMVVEWQILASAPRVAVLARPDSNRLVLGVWVCCV